jgi:hypothetical protein
MNFFLRALSLLVLMSLEIGVAAAHDASTEELSALAKFLDDFEGQFSNSTFGPAVTLGDSGKIQSYLKKDLIVRIDPVYDLQGLYEPANSLWFGGLWGMEFRNNRLTVRDLSRDGGVTLWHEYMHHVIHLAGKQECGPEEAYTELLEDRVRWLLRLNKEFNSIYQTAGLLVLRI